MIIGTRTSPVSWAPGIFKNPGIIIHKGITNNCFNKFQVFIGGWGNTKSVIRRNQTKPDMVEVDTPQILNGGEFRGFWVRWDGGVVSAGREGEVIPFMSWTDPEPFPVAFVGVATGWGASGTWKIEGMESILMP